MSYADKICKAADRREAAKAMQEGISHYGAILNMLVNSTPWDDLPILVASMQMVAQAMRQVIGETGRKIVDQIVTDSTAVAINVGARRKERGEG